MGIEMVECEDEELYGKEYLQWKKKTLGNQVSDHKYTCDFSKKQGVDSDEDDDHGEAEEEDDGQFLDEEEYQLELAHGYVKKGEKPKGRCLGMIVEGGYMFKMDPDLSNFPCVTWHCPKYKVDGCPASFVTRVTNVEAVKGSLKKPDDVNEVARSLEASHVMECQDKIEGHANHRPGHYKDNIHPLIYGLFSREVREALAKYLRGLLAPCFPLPERSEAEAVVDQQLNPEMTESSLFTVEQSSLVTVS